MADASGVRVVIDEDDNLERIDPVTGAMEQDQPDGGVVVKLGDHRRKKEDGDDWFRNLADDIDGIELGEIADDLKAAIEADDRSRGDYLATRANGLGLLGLKIEAPGGSVGDSTAGIEGMSKVTNPLLLEALLKGWANAQAELLPADGPMKVKVDGLETPLEDDLADALERDFNHWFTKTASEYYPDTSHMLLWGTYFGGAGIKKVYRCPMRRRPVSDSVDVKDFIVSDATKDLRACARITHYIPMRPSVMRRMQLLGAYRDVELTQPAPAPTNAITDKIAGIQGTQADKTRPEDEPYNLWESQCELDLDEFIPAGSQFKGEGIPLPYLVTLDKDSSTILAIRRDWNEDDDHCERKRLYVKYPYVPGPGFYGTGMLNILGNATAAMTAAWREALDAGMYANFPAGLIAKMGARQNSSIFRLSPGEFDPIETNNLPINQVVMPMPYKDVTPGLLALIDKIVQQSQGLGGAADIPSAEGIQNVPVGTMMAQIEQATKVIAAAHKGMHQAQSQEFDLIVDLFRETPEDFWKSNKVCPQGFWDEQRFTSALDNCNIVPVSDPNVPSHLHRVAKALALVQLVAIPAFAPHMDPKETLLRCLRVIREDPTGLVIDPPPQAPQQDPNVLKAQAAMLTAQSNAAQAQKKTEFDAAKLQLEREIAQTNLQREAIIHQADQTKIAAEQRREEMALHAQNQHQQFQQQHALREHDLATRAQALTAAKAEHDAAMARGQQQLASGGAVNDAQSEQMKLQSEHEHRMRTHVLAQQEHELEKAKTAHEMELEKHQHALEVARHNSEHAARMTELDHKEKEIAIKKTVAEKPAPKPAAKGRAMGGRVNEDEDDDPLAKAFTKLAAALERQASSNDRLAAVQGAERVIVNDANGKPRGIRTLQ